MTGANASFTANGATCCGSALHYDYYNSSCTQKAIVYERDVYINIVSTIIDVQPIGGEICMGGSKTLSVSARTNQSGGITYQWYKDGEPIPGATEQSYYEEGGLNGYYQVLMTTADGTVYRSCEYEMRPITALDELNAPVHLYPVPTLAGSMMQIQAEESGTLYFYNLQGVCCGRHTVEVGTRSVPSPAVSGIYLARFVSATEHLFTCKLIVL